MKLRVSVVLPRGGTHDVTLSCDVTATVSDAARALVRAGLSGDSRVEELARQRTSPLTLRAIPSAGSATVLLDPAVPIGVSGVQSGWIIQPIPEFETRGDCERLIEVAGYVEVLSGEQRGAQFSLIAGTNLVGRDRACRVLLLDTSVSRRHAEITVGVDGARRDARCRDGDMVLRDLGSANGILVSGEIRSELRISEAMTVRLGEVELRITPGPPASQIQRFDHRTVHTRAPRVAPRFPESERELPAAPTPMQPSRVPFVAMLAPMLMGGAMYAVTRSPMSLMMIAFSPMMMIGSWLDSRLGGKRKLKRDTALFEADLASERVELAQLRSQEIEVRATETPTIDEVQAAIARRDELLWTRRPEHRSFLEVRFGEGTLPSRTDLRLPSRGESPQWQWEMLQSLADEFEDVAPVPVIERFERSGSIGVAGESLWAEGMATSLVLQLVGLHSPYEVVLACFAGMQHRETWGWLKWLPHVDPVASPIPAWQLADSEQSSLRLLAALEGVLEARRAAG
ncbi:MAG: FHA domain-containing protein [Leucobacter sp.]